MPISAWSTTASDNDDADLASGIDWRENQAPSTVNDSSRAMMAVLATWRDDVTQAVSRTTVTTAVASVVIPLPSTYNSFDIRFAGVRPSTSGQDLRFRFSTDNGVSYVSSSGSYQYVLNYNSNATTPAVLHATTATSGPVTPNIQNVTASGAHGLLQLERGGGGYGGFLADATAFDASSVYERIAGGGQFVNTSTVTHIQLFMTSGNIAAGRFTLIGYK